MDLHTYYIWTICVSTLICKYICGTERGVGNETQPTSRGPEGKINLTQLNVGGKHLFH